MVRMLEGVPFNCSAASTSYIICHHQIFHMQNVLSAYKNPESGLGMRLQELDV